MSDDRAALLSEWVRAKETLGQWEAYERKLRQQLSVAMFGDYGDGSRTVEVGGGYKLNNLNVTRYDIADNAEMRQLVRNFISYEATAAAGKALIKDKPRLSMRGYKALPTWGRTMLDKHVTTTPQAPQLSLIIPKG